MAKEDKKNDTITIKKDDLWKYATFVLAAVVIVLLIVIFTGGDSGTKVAVDNDQPSGGNRLTGVAAYKQYAEDLDLDTSEFDNCLDSGEKEGKVDDDLALGSSQGIRGTPGFIVHGQLVSGAQPFNVFEQIVDAALNGAAPGSIDPQLNEDDQFLFGDADASVVIIEYSDFQCPFCQRAYEGAVGNMKSKYGDNPDVALVYRHFPLKSIHPLAQKSAEATECAGDQGKFAEMHDLIFEVGV